MNGTAVVDYFKRIIDSEDDFSEAIAAIQTLIESIRLSNAETLAELIDSMKSDINTLTTTDQDGVITAIESCCNQFLRFITLASSALENREFQQCKETLISRGNVFLDKLKKSRKKIAKLADPFIFDGTTILTHSRSRVVLSLLKTAAAAKKRFTVYVTESMPDRKGVRMVQELTDSGIHALLILDAAVGCEMEKVDMVLVGAEGVVESGGIINKVGTYSIAICAKEMHKPLYVVTESFKFTRMYPLNQQDVPDKYKFRPQRSRNMMDDDLSTTCPLVDYTPPSYITLLFTDIGILTPSAVSDELIKLYT